MVSPRYSSIYLVKDLVWRSNFCPRRLIAQIILVASKRSFAIVRSSQANDRLRSFPLHKQTIVWDRLLFTSKRLFAIVRSSQANDRLRSITLHKQTIVFDLSLFTSRRLFAIVHSFKQTMEQKLSPEQSKLNQSCNQPESSPTSMERTGARNSANMAINSEVHQPQNPSYDSEVYQPQNPSYFLQDTSANGDLCNHCTSNDI